MNLRHILNLLVGLILPVFHLVTAIFEGDSCSQGDAHRRDCVVCLCSKDETWACKRDMCDDCAEGTVMTRDNYNYFCDNGRWRYVPFFQLPGDQVELPFGPCRNETFKPDWPCNRCRCNNVWECPLVLCREEGMLKEYSHKLRKTKLDELYAFFKYDGKKEVCKEGETRDQDSCNICKCEGETWWCELRLCAELDSEAHDPDPDEIDQGVIDTHQDIFKMDELEEIGNNEPTSAGTTEVSDITAPDMYPENPEL